MDSTVIAVFLTGLLGGVHCAGMCGGIVGALGVLAQRDEHRSTGSHRTGAALSVTMPMQLVPSPAGLAASPTVRQGTQGSGRLHWAAPLRSSAPSLRSTRLDVLLAYNAGRLGSYVLLGAAAGTAGSFSWLLGEALPLQQIAFAITNLLLVVMGLYVAGWRRIGHALERAGQVLWRHVKPHAAAALQRRGRVAAVAAGGLWGLVPCGMVYAVLASALLSGSALNGATLMLAFGLGTLPNLLLLGVSGAALANAARNRRVRLAFGSLIVAFGVLGMLRLHVASEIPLLRNLCVHLPVFGA